MDIPIFSKLYDFYGFLSQVILSFPKTKRYTIGEKLDKLTLEIIELIFSIPYSQNKLVTLQEISIKLDLIKVILRLAKDNQCLKSRNYLILQSTLQEVGKMLGGWIRAAKQKSPQ